MFAILVLAGCRTRTSLSEVPIVGGSDEVVALVREAIDTFERDTGGGRIRLVEVRFGDISARGKYDSNLDRITLHRDSVPGRDLVDTVVHELCHVLDVTEDLVAEQPDLWDTLAEVMYDPAADVMLEPDEGGVRERRHEAFAGWCSRGAADAAVLASPCPGDPPEVTEAMAWLVEHVWTGARPWAAAEPAAGPGWSFEAPFPVDRLDLEVTDDPDVVEIVTRRDLSLVEREFGVERLDLRTGERVPDAEVTVRPWQGGVPEGLPSGGSWSAAGWESGPAAAIGSIRWHYPDQSAPRLLWSAGGDWATVGDGCVEVDDARLVSGADDVWLGWTEDRTVRLAPVASGEGGR